MTDPVPAHPVLEDLPDPFATVTPGAWTSYGRRILSWAVTTPGRLYRNDYEAAWVEVTEQILWRGEPLSLWAWRRTTLDVGRAGFTDRARRELEEQFLPSIARYGFDRLWIAYHQIRVAQTDWDRPVRRAQAELRWWAARAELASLHTHGRLDFRPVTHPDRSTLTQTVLAGDRRQDRQPVIAEALCAGEAVGWMTNQSELIPDQSLLTDDL